MNSEKPISNDVEQADFEKNKVMAILAYIFFLIPLLAAKESPFAMYHANQGLLLFISAIAVNIIGSFIPVIGWLLIIPFGNLTVLVFCVLGIINAANGKKQPLPLIGGFNLIHT